MVIDGHAPYVLMLTLKLPGLIREWWSLLRRSTLDQGCEPAAGGASVIVRAMW